MLNGIRYSIEMYEVAYVNLYKTLENHIPYDLSGEVGQTPTGVFPAVLLQAWSMVDSANRLRLLLQHTPRLPRRDAHFRANFRKLEIAENLRNPIQHLNREITVRAEDVEVQPVWGSLSWGRLLSTEPPRAHAYLLIPGSIEYMNHLPIKNIVGQQFQNTIDHIELTAYGSTVSLSGIYTAIAKLSTLLEDGLQNAFEDDERLTNRLATDLIVTLQLS